MCCVVKNLAFLILNKKIATRRFAAHIQRASFLVCFYAIAKTEHQSQCDVSQMCTLSLSIPGESSNTFFLLDIFIHFLFYHITPGIPVRKYSALI
jgi:hypothetical protein